MVIGVWTLLLALSLGLNATLLGDVLSGSSEKTKINFTNDPESARAERILEERLRGPRKVTEVVVVTSTGLTVDDVAYEEFVGNLFARITAIGPAVIEGGTNYHLAGDESLVSKDRHTTILPFVMAGDEAEAQKEIHLVLDIIDEANRDTRFNVLIAGPGSLGSAFREAVARDLRVAEMVGIPLALVVLLVVFGSVTAALIPVGLAILALAVALGATALIGQGIDFSFVVVNIELMMGLAAGIDYSLFVVSRYREERILGIEKYAAIANTGASASRTVLVSGIMVVVSLLGLLVVPLEAFRSLALGAALAVGMSILVSLTLLPAMLGILGDRVNSLAIPFLQGSRGRRQGEKSDRFRNRLTGWVMKHPVPSLLLSAGAMVSLGLPLAGIQTGSTGVSTLPEEAPAAEAFQILEDEFSYGLASPTEIVIEGDVSAAGVQESIDRLTRYLAGDEMFGEPADLQVSGSGNVALLAVPVSGDPISDPTIEAVRRLRSNYVPAAFSNSDASVLVGGMTSNDIDYLDLVNTYFPLVVLFVLTLSFVLMMVVFRSLIVPLKAVAMNLLSVAASFGLLVLVFQRGIGNKLLGFQRADVIEAWVPVFIFAILFGLSMDYHVFLLSRIRERFTHSRDNAESIEFGVGSTAGIVIGAALVMASVFAGIAAGDMVQFQQMGFGLAVAVILDATVVRSVLVPATMKLLGDWNWYLPGILRWLPEMATEGRNPSGG